jgi:hypothetical protein
MSKMLAIVGSHTRTRHLAPWDSPDYDILVFNEAPQQDWCKRWDIAMQMHRPEVYTSLKNFVRSDHWPWLQQSHGKPIYMQDVDPRVPDSVKYPLREIMDYIPGAHLRWFKSSPAYAIALGMFLGYREMALYGLDMSSNTEYSYQLPNFQFWVGVAIGNGVIIDNNSNEQYFTGSLYAYEGELQIPRQVFIDRVDYLEREIRRAKWELEKAVNRYTDAVTDGKADKAGELVTRVEDMQLSLAELEACLDISRYYAGREDPIPRQEFERRAAEGQRDAEQARTDMWVHRGEMQYVWNIWRQTGNDSARLQFVEFANRRLQSAAECGKFTGLLHENQGYMVRMDELIEAAGGAHTVKALEGDKCQ